MNSRAPGNITSETEITNISSHGLWLFSTNKEMFLSYENFPWFKDQPVKYITNVEEISNGHYYWPDIDVDLTEAIIEHPENFPLQAKIK
ncbi:MAG: DUF2442 domain-containing protein [Pseudomonadales bacterium]|nr:DUF2442 domain-containing protein [Pseudomonadales bacterium]